MFFIFPMAQLVFWGLTLEQCHSYLEQIKEFEEHPLEEMEMDEFTFVLGEAPKIVEDEIILPAIECFRPFSSFSWIGSIGQIRHI